MAATCGPDTLAYALNKATGLRTLNVNGATSAQAIGQYYDAPQPITVHGVRFYAYKINVSGGLTQNMVVEIYNARPDSLPLGAPLSSTTVLLDTNFYGGQLSGLEKVAVFSSPVTVTGPYIVAVRNNSGNPCGVVVNDYVAGDGLAEWLGHAQITGSWRHGYQVNVAGTPFNCDELLDPIVTYSLKANFTANPNCIATAGNATFTNTSSPILRNRMYNLAEFLGLGGLGVTWNFGDGSGFQTQITGYDTTHFYPVAGNYTVHLGDTIFGWTMNCGADTSITLGQAPTAAFTESTNNLTAMFTNQSTNFPTSWLWDFGDGQTSTAQNPQHTYALGGTYTVCMTATSMCGSDSVCHSVTVSCPVPSTSFSSNPNNLTVNFTDQTTGNGVNTWMWTFGDGGSSLVQNPNYTYATPGTYLVCLTTSNSCGSDSACITLTVSCPTPGAAFTESGPGLTVSFTDQSTGSVTGHAWDFGDGGTSAVQNPSHVYAAAGTYLVCLTATNACGNDSTCKNIQVPLVGVDVGFAGVEVVVSPNPAGNLVRVAVVLRQDEMMDLTVYNSLGMKVREMDLGLVKAGEWELDVREWAAGSYLLRLTTDSGMVSRRMNVMR
jgi:PKD repeat protein